MGRKRALDLDRFGTLVFVLLFVMTSLVPPLPAQASVAGTCAVASFSGPTNFAVGTFPLSVAVGDFNAMASST